MRVILHHDKIEEESIICSYRDSCMYMARMFMKNENNVITSHQATFKQIKEIYEIFTKGDNSKI